MEPRLHRLLLLRGLDKSQSEDVVQEVAYRALSHAVPFDTPEDLYAWSAAVARRLHVDLVRAQGRTTGGDGLSLLAATTDVEHEVERRIVLERTLAALATLGEADQAAILEPAPAATSTREATRYAVRRHRARKRLRGMIKGGLGWAAVLRAIRRAGEFNLVTVTATALLAVPALLVAVLPGGDPARPAPGAAPTFVSPVTADRWSAGGTELVRTAGAVARPTPVPQPGPLDDEGENPPTGGDPGPGLPSVTPTNNPDGRAVCLIGDGPVNPGCVYWPTGRDLSTPPPGLPGAVAN